MKQHEHFVAITLVTLAIVGVLAFVLMQNQSKREQARAVDEPQQRAPLVFDADDHLDEALKELNAVKE